MLRLLSFLFLVSAFFSCLPEKTALERALREAGDNRMELEKVLAYYRDDTLKYQAACFLIENMPDQYAVLYHWIPRTHTHGLCCLWIRRIPSVGKYPVRLWPLYSILFQKSNPNPGLK